VEIQLPRPRPWWRRWLRRILVTLLLALIGIGFRFYFRHRKVVTELEQALAALDRDEPGWRLKDVEAARAAVPDSENGALCVVETVRLLPQKWPPEQFDRQFTDLPPPEQLSPAAYAELCKELDGLRPALDEARKLATRPDGRHKITYLRNTLNTLLKDQSEVRGVTQLLTYDVLRQAQAADMKAALASCRAALNAGRSLGDEPLAISQLLRTSAVLSACQSVERALAQGEPAADDLAEVQRELEREADYPALLVAMRGERALMHEMFDAMESGDVTFSQVGGNANTPRSWKEVLFGWLMRDNLRAEHPTYLTLATHRVAEVRLPPPDQAAAERAFAAEVRALPKQAIFTRLLLPAVEKLGVAERRRLAVLRCTAVCLAAERFRKARAAWPESLDKLVPAQLAAVPLDPFDGQPLRYRRTEDGVVVYSVGPDGEDNGGTFDRKEALRPGTDMGHRLWDVKLRRQPPRPAPPAPKDQPEAP
jgi:hypothetical protein